MALPSSGHCSCHRTSGFVIIYKWPLRRLMNYWMHEESSNFWVFCTLAVKYSKAPGMFSLLKYKMKILLHFEGVDKAFILGWGTLLDLRHAMHILNMIAVALINGRRQISFSQQEGDKLLQYPRWLHTFTHSSWLNAPIWPCSWQLHFRFQVQDLFLIVNNLFLT